MVIGSTPGGYTSTLGVAGRVVHTHASLAQYNLLLAKGRCCSAAGKVTADLADSINS